MKKNKNKNPLLHLKYVKQLVHQLVGNFWKERSRFLTSASETKLDEKLHIMQKGKKQDCAIYSNRQEKGKRRETSEFCDSPERPHMHMGDCFQKYHAMTNYKT